MMQALKDWSFTKVVLMSGAWILLCLAALAAVVLWQLRGLASASSTGSGGIAAVSFGFNVLLLAIPLGPPIVLMIVWRILRA